jgi:hypothetical protein
MTRDSIIWWLAIAGAVLTYLAAAPSPADWTYADWVKALAFVVATLSGKLATSPLPSKEDQLWADKRVDRRFPDE